MLLPDVMKARLASESFIKQCNDRFDEIDVDKAKADAAAAEAAAIKAVEDMENAVMMGEDHEADEVITEDQIAQAAAAATKAEEDAAAAMTAAEDAVAALHDGTIEVSELDKICDELHFMVIDNIEHPLKDAGMVETKDINAEFMAIFDRDGDRVINRDEFRVFCRLQVIVVYLHNQEVSY